MAESAFGLANFKQNTFVTIEDKADSGEFFIVRQGKVQLIREINVIEDTSMPSICNPGDFFGVVSCMSSHNRLESAVALAENAGGRFPFLAVDRVAHGGLPGEFVEQTD